MDLKPYSAPKVPSKAPEHFALFNAGLLATLALVIDYIIVRDDGIERALGEAANQGQLILWVLLVWGLLRYRRMKAERRKAEYFERLRAGMSGEYPLARDQGS